jgi:hypothetical protein
MDENQEKSKEAMKNIWDETSDNFLLFKEMIRGMFKRTTTNLNRIPKDFRRAQRIKHLRRGNEPLRYSIDINSIHIGKFQGSIKPMKRRFRGVSKTASRTN